MTSPLISFHQASFRKGGAPVLDKIDWQIRPGEHWAITGSVGAGKTAFLEALLQKLHRSGGEATYRLAADASLSLYQQLRQDVALVTFGENSRLLNYGDFFYQQRYHAALTESGIDLRSYLFSARKPAPDDFQLIDRLGLTDLLDLNMIKLSNGQTRKALIARALLQHPRLLLLDDPFLGLDAAYRDQLMSWLNELMGSCMQLVLVTQPGRIPENITHVLQLSDGRVEWLGSRAHYFRFLTTRPPVPDPELPRLLTPPIEADFALAFALNDVTVRYGERIILDGVDWTVNRGEQWALLGHNGAGKSVLLSLLYGDHPQAYANDVRLFDRRRGQGESIWDIKRRIGFVSPELHLYFRQPLSAQEVAFTALTDSLTAPRRVAEHHRQDAAALFAYFGLEDRMDRPFSSFSTGEQRLLLLIRAFLKQAPCLILDEPFQALDDSLMVRAKRLTEAVATDRTLLFVTHYAHEIPATVQQVMELRQGRVVAVRNPGL